MKKQKRKPKASEDNTSVPNYHFNGGTLKASTTNNIVREGWDGN